MWSFSGAASLLTVDDRVCRAMSIASGSILGFAVRLAYDATLVNSSDLILVDLAIEVATQKRIDRLQIFSNP